ncbi:MAG: PLP-dependent aminotransferase family protein [Clostridiales bacterium]|nr:PLP-dependent aminotransferase family protein [Clostridiales bacterium]
MVTIDISYAQRMQGLSGSAIRELFAFSAKPGVISFAGGNPGSFALPDEQVAQIASDLLRRDGKAILQYGQTEGYPPLRQSLPGYIRQTFGADVQEDQVLITTGSMQGLDLLLKALVNPGDAVLTESPAFLGALQAMNSYQANIVPVRSDDSGIDIAHLEEMMRRHSPKLLYIIPTFQNPTGCSLALDRRQQVAELAAKYRVVVAEDDPYHSLRYKGKHLPAIKAFDREGWVVLLGSFSKVVSPGLRVGFMAGDAHLLRRCGVCKQCTDVHTANLNQGIVDAYLRGGLLDPHISRICGQYAGLMDTMLQQLALTPRIRHFTRPEGGLFIFVHLEEGLQADQLFRSAVERGVAFVPGEHFYPEGGHHNTLRLNFSNADQAAILRGMEILSDCIKHMG